MERKNLLGTTTACLICMNDADRLKGAVILYIYKIFTKNSLSVANY